MPLGDANGGEGSGGGGGAASPSMKGKYCIVTGSNSGIGLQVARGLMSRGAHVVMACRNMTACESAAQRLREEGLPGSCACRVVDLEDTDSIRAFARQQAVDLRSEAGAVAPLAAAAATAAAAGPAKGQQPSLPSAPGAETSAAAEVRMAAGADTTASLRRIDVLVNNAGVMGVARAPDGSDRHLTANHLGPYLLTRLLLPHMTHGSRVINVASRAHFAGSLALVSSPTGSEAITDNTHHWWWQYARSKLCNVLFTAELQRRYGYGSGAASGTASGGGHGSGAGIGAHAVSPGLVNTGIFRYLLPSWAQWLRAPLRPLFRTPQQGAEVVLYAASSPELQGRNSLFLHDCREVQPSTAARDSLLAADLWRVSATLVGLPADEDGSSSQGSGLDEIK